MSKPKHSCIFHRESYIYWCICVKCPKTLDICLQWTSRNMAFVCSVRRATTTNTWLIYCVCDTIDPLTIAQGRWLQEAPPYRPDSTLASAQNLIQLLVKHSPFESQQPHTQVPKVSCAFAVGIGWPAYWAQRSQVAEASCV